MQIIEKIAGAQMVMNDFKELLILHIKTMVCDPKHLWSNFNWEQSKSNPLIKLVKSDSRKRKEETRRKEESSRTSNQDQ